MKRIPQKLILTQFIYFEKRIHMQTFMQRYESCHCTIFISYLHFTDIKFKVSLLLIFHFQQTKKGDIYRHFAYFNWKLPIQNVYRIFHYGVYIYILKVPLIIISN